ncbi:BnaCnng46090D [Brassica napus]|uniref:BnaCnng46090D protein n=1 Tax=Brassica napus TaxID=3708 RepID=A0A078JHQ2_BRANA|nr:BnaCnng46090D [Brassica napus]
MVMNLKYVDPAYMIRTVSTNASNTVYFRLLAQSVVHGAVAGYTSYISSLINRRQTYIPYSVSY